MLWQNTWYAQKKRNGQQRKGALLWCSRGFGSDRFGLYCCRGFRAELINPEDVIAAVGTVARLMRKHLAMGDSVTLPGLGTFTVSASSEGCQTPEECTPAKVKPMRVCYRANPEMRCVLAEIKYEKRERHRAGVAAAQ